MTLLPLHHPNNDNDSQKRRISNSHKAYTSGELFDRPNYSRSHYRWQNMTKVFRRLFWFVFLGSVLHLLRTMFWILPVEQQQQAPPPQGSSLRPYSNTTSAAGDASSERQRQQPMCHVEPAQPWRTSELTLLATTSFANGTWHRNNSKVLHYQTPLDFLEMADKELLDDEARCYYMYPLAPKMHFPHAMQQLYRCISFFRHYGKGRRWVVLHPSRWPKEYSFKSWLREFLTPSLGGGSGDPATAPSDGRRLDHHHGDHTNASSTDNHNNTRIETERRLLQQEKLHGDFHDGFVASMVLHMGIEFRPVSEAYEAKFVNHTRPADETIWEQKYFDFGLLPDDARFMAERILGGEDQHQLQQQQQPRRRRLNGPQPPRAIAPQTESAPQNNDAADDDETTRTTHDPLDADAQRIPRIAILNRAGTSRHLSNDLDLARAIEDATGVPVPIQYFENTTFSQQATFFAQTDILITPHGAQLTGLPFMRAGIAPELGHCRAVVEVYGDNICNPYYFGSLAVNSGLHHSYVAMGKARACHYADKHRTRHRMRERPVCPPLSSLVEAAVTLTQRWRECTATTTTTTTTAAAA